MEHKTFPNITRVKIPLDYYYMGEDTKCPACDEEGYVYGHCDPNEDGGYSGEFLCTKCEYEWSKI
jgi:hypothetical protein